jgi:hypothetical protein
MGGGATAFLSANQRSAAGAAHQGDREMGSLKSVAVHVAAALVLSLAAAAPAAAQQTPPAADTAAAPVSASADVKAAKGVDKKEPVEEGTEFTAGTKVWVWSKVHGAKDTKVKHVWKKDGKESWTATLDVKNDNWATYSRRTVKAGQYTVEVVGADGTKLGEVTFTVN